jgi:hypothetical protein
MFINKLLKFQCQIQIVLIVVQRFIFNTGGLNRGRQTEWRVYVFQKVSRVISDISNVREQHSALIIDSIIKLLFNCRHKPSISELINIMHYRILISTIFFLL